MFNSDPPLDPWITTPPLRCLSQVVQVLALPPARTLVANFGQLAADPRHGWLPSDSLDPWGRGPSFMGYDIEAKTMVRSEPR